jgi:hypothetical protein
VNAQKTFVVMRMLIKKKISISLKFFTKIVGISMVIRMGKTNKKRTNNILFYKPSAADRKFDSINLSAAIHKCM